MALIVKPRPRRNRCEIAVAARQRDDGAPHGLARGVFCNCHAERARLKCDEPRGGVPPLVRRRRASNLAIGVVLTALAIGALASAAVLTALKTGVQLQDFLVPATLLAALGAAFLLLAGLDRTPPR